MRKRYIVTILTALAIVAYMTLDDRNASEEIITESLMDQEPDYIIEGLNSDSFDEQGNLIQQIAARKASHYPADDITLLEGPTVLLHENNLPKWGIRSNRGQLIKDQRILLEGEVIIVPLQSTGNDFSLTTASLNIDLQEKIADTDQTVLIESDTSELSAIGMTILLDKQLVNFKSQVRGRHVPKAP